MPQTSSNENRTIARPKAAEPAGSPHRRRTRLPLAPVATVSATGSGRGTGRAVSVPVFQKKLRERAAETTGPTGTADPETAPAAPRANPVVEAIRILGARLERLPGGRFRLDGRPADRRALVLAANRERRSRGLKALPYPGADG